MYGCIIGNILPKQYFSCVRQLRRRRSEKVSNTTTLVPVPQVQFMQAFKYHNFFVVFAGRTVVRWVEYFSKNSTGFTSFQRQNSTAREGSRPLLHRKIRYATHTSHHHPPTMARAVAPVPQCYFCYFYMMPSSYHHIVSVNDRRHYYL